MSGSRVGDDGVLVVSVVVDDGGDRLPAVLDVVKVAPDVAAVDDGRVIRLEKEKKRKLAKMHLKGERIRDRCGFELEEA